MWVQKLAYGFNSTLFLTIFLLKSKETWPKTCIFLKIWNFFQKQPSHVSPKLDSGEEEREMSSALSWLQIAMNPLGALHSCFPKGSSYVKSFLDTIVLTELLTWFFVSIFDNHICAWFDLFDFFLFGSVFFIQNILEIQWNNA